MSGLVQDESQEIISSSSVQHQQQQYFLLQETLLNFEPINSDLLVGIESQFDHFQDIQNFNIWHLKKKNF